MTHLASDSEINYIEVRGVKFAYREANNTNKQVLVLLHGLAESSAFFWHPLIHTFSKRYRIIAFDMLGHGSSDSYVSSYSPFKQAALIKEALEQLGVKKTIFIAHSLGGMVAIAFSLLYPQSIEKLVLYSVPISKGVFRTVPEMLTENSLLSLLPSFPLIFPFSGRIMKLGPMFLQRIMYKLIFKQWNIPFNYERPDFSRFQEEMLNEAVATSGIGLEKTVRNTFLFTNLYNRLGEIEIPILFIKGSRDFILSDKMQKNYLRKVKDGKSVVLLDTSHISLLDKPKDFLEIVDNFLYTSNTQELTPDVVNRN